MPTFSRLPGTTQLPARQTSALRMRVSMSAMGSVIMASALLPGSLAHPRDLALQRQQTETAAADAELAIVGARAPAQLATVVAPRRELGLALLLYLQALLRHCWSLTAVLDGSGPRWRLLAERHAEPGEEGLALLVGLGGGDE